MAVWAVYGLGASRGWDHGPGDRKVSFMDLGKLSGWDHGPGGLCLKLPRWLRSFGVQCVGSVRARGEGVEGWMEGRRVEGVWRDGGMEGERMSLI